MKKIGLFALIAMILAACGPSENAVEIGQSQRAIEAARAAQEASRASLMAAQGVSHMDRGQTLVLLLMTLIFIVLLVLAVYLVLRRLIRLQRLFRQFSTGQISSGRWISGHNEHWRKSEEPALYQQILLDQQWLLTQLLSQGHEDANIGSNDLLDLPHDWWS